MWMDCGGSCGGSYGVGGMIFRQAFSQKPQGRDFIYRVCERTLSGFILFLFCRQACFSQKPQGRDFI